MANILVVYGTKEGHTAWIARVIAEELRGLGHSAQILNSVGLPANLKVGSYDAVVCGASIHIGRYPTSFTKWVKMNSLDLSGLPSAFFSVCLGVLEKENAKTQSDIQKIAETFFSQCKWRPMIWTTFPGALMYSKYGWFVRLVMKRKARLAGGDVDTSRDYTYTNWDDVKQFARKFSDMLEVERNDLRSQLESWGEHNFSKGSVL